MHDNRPSPPSVPLHHHHHLSSITTSPHFHRKRQQECKNVCSRERAHTINPAHCIIQDLLFSSLSYKHTHTHTDVHTCKPREVAHGSCAERMGGRPYAAERNQNGSGEKSGEKRVVSGKNIARTQRQRSTRVRSVYEYALLCIRLYCYKIHRKAYAYVLYSRRHIFFESCVCWCFPFFVFSD